MVARNFITVPGEAFTASGTGAVERTVDDKLRDVVSVKDFGAVGDGVTDDTAAIQAAIAHCASSGQTLTGNGTFKISSKIVINCRFDGKDMTFEIYGAPAVALEVSTGNGTNPTDIFSLTTENGLILPSVINKTKPVTGWAGQGIGIRYVNVQNMKIVERLVENFAIGVQQTCYQQGCGYNTVIGGYLRNNGVNRQITVGDAVGFTNRWDYLGGRYFHSSAEGTEVSGVFHVEVVANASGNIINDHNFFGASLEGNAEQYHVECGGSFVNFYGCRWESSAPGGIKVHLAYGGITGQGSVGIFAGRGASAEDINITKDASASGRAYIQSTSGGNLITTPDAVELRNSSSATAPAFVVYEPATDIFTANPATDYAGFIGPQKIGGKRGTNTADRVWLDLLNSRIYFGDGSSATTRYLGNQSTYIASNAGFIPASDNTFALGLSSFKWSVVYAATGTINTSDEREKQDIADLDEAERRVAVSLKGLIKKFRYKDAVDLKGDDARIHVGVIAQDVIGAFEAEGLEPFSYGIVCYDEWDEELDEDGNVTIAAGNRYGIRYDELLAFIVSAL